MYSAVVRPSGSAATAPLRHRPNFSPRAGRNYVISGRPPSVKAGSPELRGLMSGMSAPGHL
eukprot:2660436-Alexandrium_andersonii.AAC.1